MRCYMHFVFSMPLRRCRCCLLQCFSAVRGQLSRRLSVVPSHQLNHTRQDRQHGLGTEQLTHSGTYRPPCTLFERMNQSLDDAELQGGWPWWWWRWALSVEAEVGLTIYPKAERVLAY
ncbi:hypothetical protein HDV63DRAFT_380674 [Trichoderma sp. SZMC 28014]